MTKQDLVEKVEIERRGILRAPSGVGGYIYPWIQHQAIEHERNKTRVNEAIAMKAQEMGYEYGDTVKYKIIIEPKR